MEEMNSPTRPNPFWRALRVLWRLLLLLLTGILVGGVIYLGFVQFYLNAVQVSQDSAARISVAETLSVQEQEQASGRMETFSQRLSSIEKQQGLLLESVSELQGKNQTLEQAAQEQSAILARLSGLEQRVVTLTTDLESNSSQDKVLQQYTMGENSPTAAMARDLQVLRAMELVSRARINLIQNNAGLARNDVQSAYDILSTMEGTTPAAQKPVVDVWLQRLKLVLGNLPGYPVMAADDLEIVWRMFADGWNSSGGSQQATPAPLTDTPTLPVQTLQPTPIPQ
jgi:hypothetical protein